MMKNHKRRKTKTRGAKRKHITGRAYYGDTDHCGSKVISKWQSARITHQTGAVGFKKALTVTKHKKQAANQAVMTAAKVSGGQESCRDALQISSGNLERAHRSTDQEVTDDKRFKKKCIREQGINTSIHQPSSVIAHGQRISCRETMQENLCWESICVTNKSYRGGGGNWELQ